MKNFLISILPTRLYLELKRFDFKVRQPENYKLIQCRRMNDFGGYSFKGFDEKKAIFVHIPKCAGISVCKALFGNLGGGHNTLEQYTYLFSPKELLSYYKFTFVRNPWDRLVSAYHFLKNGGLTEDDKSFFDDNLAKYYNFEDFVLKWINNENIMLGQHFKPQADYIIDKRGKVRVDFIGKFETIEQDFKFICDKLDVSALTLANTNGSNRGKYQQYYTEKTARIVAEVYERDIIMFGYVFE